MSRILLSHLIVISCLVLSTDCFLFGDTCLNRCHSTFHSSDDYDCQCNSQCTRHGDCCTDYQSLCVDPPPDSCQGRCHDNVNRGHPCQCNSHCTSYNDCCTDYNALCVDNTKTGGTGTCLTLTQEGQALWDSDVNRLNSSDVTVDYQTLINDGSSTDRAYRRLFSRVDESKLNGPTYAAFRNLLNNYNPDPQVTESTSSSMTNEINSFLNAVLDTKVMAVLLEYLQCQGVATSKSDLRNKLQRLWFDTYSRSHSSAQASSSGFEHVFVGEYKNSSVVNGFHSWLTFYLQEKAGSFNYLGHVSRDQPSIVGAAFTWSGRFKAKASFFIGVSPELDMALYTLCYLTHKNDVCPLTLAGHRVNIKTFDTNGHLATAYVM